MLRTVTVLIFIGLGVGAALWYVSAGTEAETQTMPPGVAAALSSSPKRPVPTGPQPDSGDPPPRPTFEGAPEISETGPWPSVVAPEPTLMFGRMEIFEEREHRFEIRNEGEAELKLVPGDTTCQCTYFELDETTVPPGGTTHLTIRWKPKSRDNLFRHGGPVFTNDPEQPAIQFTVEGGVDAAIEMAPESLWDVGSVYRDQPGRFRVLLGSRIYEQFAINSIETGSEFVTTETTPLAPGVLLKNNYLGGYAIDLVVSPEIPSGRFSTEVTLDVERAPEPLKATLTAVKQGMIRILPAPGTNYNPDEMLVRFGQFQASAGRSVRLQLIVDEKDMPEPFEVENRRSEPSFLDVSLEPIGEPTGSVRRYWLTLSVAPGKPRISYQGADLGVVELSTNHPDDEAIVLTLEMASS